MQVHVRRSLKTSESNGNSHMTKSLKPPLVRKGKLVVVDLAGSERISKSGLFYSLTLCLKRFVFFFCILKIVFCLYYIYLYQEVKDIHWRKPSLSISR